MHPRDLTYLTLAQSVLLTDGKQIKGALLLPKELLGHDTGRGNPGRAWQTLQVEETQLYAVYKKYKHYDTNRLKVKG